MEEIYNKIANDISDQLIMINKSKKRYKKSTVELYRELLKKKYKEYIPSQYQILVYIPGILAYKGYEIIEDPYFSLKKY